MALFIKEIETPLPPIPLRDANFLIGNGVRLLSCRQRERGKLNFRFYVQLCNRYVQSAIKCGIAVGGKEEIVQKCLSCFQGSHLMLMSQN